MSVGDGVWMRRNRDSAETSLEKSAYILFTEFCSDTLIQPVELAKLLNLASRKLSVFHLSDTKASELAQAMGMDPHLWNQDRGADVLGDRVGKHVYLGELRYCPACFSLGHHSTLLQLTQVMKCPIHKELLRTGCPHCGRPIPTDVLSLARHHMYCSACGRRLAAADSRASPTASTDHPPVVLFAPLRQAIMGDPLTSELRNHLPWDKLPAEVLANSMLVRRHHLYTVWGSHTMGSDFLNVKTTSFLLDVEPTPERQPEPGQLVFSPVYRKTMDAFEHLAELLERCQSPVDMPQGVLSKARVDERVSAVAAAYWQAARTMGVHKFLGGRRRGVMDWGWGPWFLPWLPEHSGALAHVVRGAVYTLFALCLARVGRLRYGVQVAWHTPPDWHQFLPPWRLLSQLGTDQLLLQIRARTDEHVVERLVSRYREHALLKVPEGVSPLALINELP